MGWLLGRVLVASSSSWQFAAVVAADLAFLPVLVAFLAWPLLRERKRNTPLLLVLLVLWLCNATLHLGLFRGDVALSRQALLTAVNFALILVTVIGGCITPSFTATALRQRGVAGAVQTPRGMTSVTVALMIAVAAVDVMQPGVASAGWLALAAAIAQAARLAQWQGWRKLHDLIVWILHLAYAWLPGFDYPAVIVLSAALWTTAFALVLWVYGPILRTPRVDSRSSVKT